MTSPLSGPVAPPSVPAVGPASRRPDRGWRWAGWLAAALVVAAALVLGRPVVAGSVGFTVFGAPASCTLRTEGSDPVALSWEQAGHAATIVGVGRALGLPEQAAVIALATAVQESRLRNLDHGDRDSLGLFQQRPSQGWGEPAQLQDPVYATQRFYEHLVQVPQYLDLPVTEAAQAVQRSAFPEAYAAHESVARTLTAALTADADGAVRCAVPADDAARPPTALRCTAAGTAAASSWLAAPGPLVRLTCRGAAVPG